MEQKNLKQMQDEKFNWIGKSVTRNNSRNDISINLIKVGTVKGKAYHGFSFVFRNKSWEKFGEFIEIAAYKNRVLFRTSPNGLRLSNKAGCKTENHYCKINSCDDKVMATFKEFIGDYELKYDSFYELYYIEK